VSYQRADAVEGWEPGGSKSIGWWGMVFFIASEALFFAYLIAAYLYLRANSATWPPNGLPRLELLFPAINSVILIGSSLPVHWARSAIERGNRSTLNRGIILTLVMGAVFLAGQGWEYSRAGFSPSDGAYGSTFFTLTGFHGAHVLAGLVFLLVVLVMSLRGRFSPERHFGVEAATMYWHFVDAVWIALFGVLYLL